MSKGQGLPDPTPGPPIDEDELVEAIEAEAEEMGEEVDLVEAYSAQTERLTAYAELIKTLLASRGFPALGGGDATLSASNQENLDAGLKRATKRAALAILRDVERIADESEPEGEGE
jgi:hypothetical protein